MFDLFKDIEKYKGITPYASEHYGVYQPLLGWESKLTKKWIQRGGVLIDPRVKLILDGRILVGPQEDHVIQYNLPWTTPLQNKGLLAVPLQPGSGKSPFRVTLAKNLNSELLSVLLIQVQTFVDNNEGRLPQDAEWNQIIGIDKFKDMEKGPLRNVNDLYAYRLLKELVEQAPIEITEETAAIARKNHLALMQYESQIARFLLAHIDGLDGLVPNDLKKLFTVREAPHLSDILLSNDDPLNNIDPNDKNSGVLSPVGFVHLFRQYFFDLGTFLGEPVEHVWLAPGTTIELIEVSTRKTIIERTEESAQETTTRSEQSSSVKDEISDAIKSENDSSTKLGVTTTAGVNYKVYQGSASASLGVESTRKDARENSHKGSREQSEKLSSEIKRSFKSVFKTVTETTDTRSRRYVLQNTGPDLINYELRRKMRRVGVQMQDLGTRLCWQVFIDDAGVNLGLADLVHFAESPDLANLKQPEIGPPPAPIKKTVSARIPFLGFRSNDDNGAGAIYGNTNLIEMIDERYKGSYRGNRTNTDDEDVQDREVVMGPFHFQFAPPQSNYVLSDVRPLGPQAAQQKATARPVEKPMFKDDGSFDLVMDSIDFGGANSFLFDVEVVYTPQKAAFDLYEVAKAAAQMKYDAEVSRLRKKNFMESVRDRIKVASNLKPRPSWDLREEERTIVYRQLISRLMLDSWKLKDTEDNRRLSHVRSEVIRALFDVDAMLYFVAPEWWLPRRHETKHNLTAQVIYRTVNLTDDDTVKWKDVASRQDNYLITEESAPARLGSSLGWLLQLDGDNLRNAFLNAPWVKAVIPIRPGREKAALNWLRAIEGHDKDGWDTTYTPVTDEDHQLLAQLDAEGKLGTIGNVLEKIAERMGQENGDIQNVLKADEVFEHGFSHLKDSFDAGLPANEVFSQSITVLPTDQIVAQAYEPTNLITQDA
jgi:hypothetical protein